MSRLLRPIMTHSICLILLSCACYPGAAGAYRKSGWQPFNQGELGLASTQLPNAVRIEFGLVEVYYRLALTDATLGLCSHARCVQEDAKRMEANRAPTGAQGAAHQFEPTRQRPTQVLAVNSNYAAVQRWFGRVSEPMVVTPEPVSLALFGSGLTLVGLALLRRSRRAKWSKSTRYAHHAVDRSYVRLARNANRVQSPVSDFRVPDRFVTTCVPSAPK